MDLLNYKIIKKSDDCPWVVFLHGIGGGSSIWCRQIKDFKKHFNLILIDLPGHGSSVYGLKDMISQGFDDIAIEVLKVLDFNNINKAHFVGISLGTIVIQAINELQPKRVISMILGGAVENINWASKCIAKIAYLTKNLIPYITIYKLCALVLMPRKRHKESREAFIKEAKKLGHEEFFTWYHLHNEVNNLIKKTKFKKNSTPKLYIMGSEDYMFLPYVKSKVNKTKNEMLLVIEKCGHVCNIEKYKEFNDISINYLLQFT